MSSIAFFMFSQHENYGCLLRVYLLFISSHFHSVIHTITILLYQVHSWSRPSIRDGFKGKKAKNKQMKRHGTWSLEIYSPLDMANITNTYKISTMISIMLRANMLWEHVNRGIWSIQGYQRSTLERDPWCKLCRISRT